MKRRKNTNHTITTQSGRGPGALLAPLLLLGGLALPCAALAQGKAAAEAQSLDDLFGGPPPAAPAQATKPDAPAPATPGTAGKQAAPEAVPESLDALFGAPAADTKAPPAGAATAPEPTPAQAPAPMPAQEPVLAAAPERTTPPRPRLTGFYQNDLAYTYGAPEHWSKFRNTLDLAADGRAGAGMAWKLGGRFVFDPIYDWTDHYNQAVRKDQRLEASIREAYLDISAGDWDYRLGRQHIVWGEMVGLFFADVVSAKDLRELALPDFDILRIPQWAARAEYFQDDFHAELVWIPYMTYDDIGKPGAEFYPFTPTAIAGTTSVIAAEKRPHGLDDAAFGARLSYLKSGWDVSGFLYSTKDPAAAFARVTPLPATTIVYQPVHERIHQLGATLGKDLGPMVLKAEAVYTKDKLFNVTRLSDADGLVKQDMLDYIVGLEWSFPEETRFNVQLYQRWFPDHDPDIVPDDTESGFSLLFSTQALHPKLEPKLLFIHSLNRSDWLAQLKVIWRLDGNWRATFGADLFGGSASGLFGQFGNRDRVYSEVRYSF